jgi:GntR family transcriptional regulator
MATRPLNNGAGVSRYLRLYSVLSQALSEGRIGAGTALPGEPRLMREYRVSRSTVRRALGRLEAEGRIVRKRGSGTYARDPATRPTPVDLSPTLDGAAAVSTITNYRTTAFEHIPTPRSLPREPPGFGDKTLLIRRIGYMRREPVVLEIIYLPDAIGRRLTRSRLTGKGGSILPILASLGHRSARVQREFAALPADPLAASGLRLAVGAPILNVRTAAHDSQDRILVYINLFYRRDRCEARATIELSGQRQNRTGRRGGAEIRSP